MMMMALIVRVMLLGIHYHIQHSIQFTLMHVWTQKMDEAYGESKTLFSLSMLSVCHYDFITSR